MASCRKTIKKAHSDSVDFSALVCPRNRRDDQHHSPDNSRLRRFPRELYQLQSPARGSPDLARRVQQLLSPTPLQLDNSWGLDHGTWSVLRHVFPDADVPVVQLSIDETQPALSYFEIGRRLAPLRDEDILIVCSGNLVHNLHTYAWGRHMPTPYDWAGRVEEESREIMLSGESVVLIDYEKFGQYAMLSIPTPDHYLALLYVLGTQQPGDVVTFPVQGIDGGSISMLSVRIDSSAVRSVESVECEWH